MEQVYVKMPYVLSESFDFTTLIPVVILLIISALIPTVLSIIHAKFIPVLVVEIVVGFVLANIPNMKSLFMEKETLSPLMEGLFVIGLSVFLFLSGLDTDFSIMTHSKEKSFRVGRLTNILLCIVIVISVGFSFLFREYMNNQTIGIILLSIVLSSTFASMVIPLVHDNGLGESTIGKIISSYATKAEFISIVSLSIMMLVVGMTNEKKPYLLLVLCVILILVYICTRYFKFKIFIQMADGIVHFGMRLIVALLLALIILCSVSGVEYILGSFLAGMVIKLAHVKETTIHKVEILGYGIFVPITCILVGFKVGMIMPIDAFFKLENIILIMELFLVLVVVKLPFIILLKWYKFSTVIQTMFFVTCTLIVSITVEEFGVLQPQFANALIVASCLTSIIPPILFDTTKSFGYSRVDDERIMNPNIKYKKIKKEKENAN